MVQGEIRNGIVEQDPLKGTRNDEHATHFGDGYPVPRAPGRKLSL